REGVAPQAWRRPHPDGARGGLRTRGASVNRLGANRLEALGELLPRPLDPLRSITLKISILPLGSGAAGAVYLWLEYRWLPPLATTLVALAIVLLTAQVLAHGMTRPLREMTAAAIAMAQGDYTRRVRATSQDEVGRLA